MNRKTLPPDVVEHRLQVWREHGHSSNKAAQVCGVDRRTFDKFLDRYAGSERAENHAHGYLAQTEAEALPLPPKGGVARYILTSAQNNTKAHIKFLRNLEVFADHTGAEIKISRFTYNKNAYKGARKAGQKSEKEDLYYDPAIAPYVSDDIEMLAPTLAWCGNLQISPTAVTPLSGFDSYTGEASTIVPHTKVQMMPVATPRSQPCKHLYTTGAVTMKNYIMAKAGQKAEFHHTNAALLVEVLPDGNWFARQLVADSRGAFCDHPYRVANGQIKESAKVEAVQWGDIHVANMDGKIREMFWGDGGVLDTLRPKIQLFHDLVDGESHNPHTQKDYLEQYRLAVDGRSNIAEEFRQAREFIDEYAHRKWCEGVVVWSNHDAFLYRYMQATDYKKDHENADLIIELEREARKAIRSGGPARLFATALATEKCRVMDDDGSPLMICDINAAYHGHAGAGGSRGSVKQYAKLGLKTMSGHSHAAWWIDGATSAGTCSKLDLGYNKGPSPWSHTFTVVYKGGKRQQITANADIGRWRAQ